jgi:AcrR family transcriptional regulator
MPRGFNAHEKDSIRNGLLEAGRKKLISTGMHKTSVEELARAAYISKGAFYQFFPSKEALFITLFAEAEREYRHQLREFARRPGKTPSARLLAFLRNALRCYRGEPLLSKFSREDMNALMRTLTPAGMRAATLDDEAFIEELFEIWRRSGLRVKCTPFQFSAVMQVLFFIDLDVQELGESHASAIDLMLEALADKLTT